MPPQPSPSCCSCCPLQALLLVSVGEYLVCVCGLCSPLTLCVSVAYVVHSPCSNWSEAHASLPTQWSCMLSLQGSLLRRHYIPSCNDLSVAHLHLRCADTECVDPSDTRSGCDNDLSLQLNPAHWPCHMDHQRTTYQ